MVDEDGILSVSIPTDSIVLYSVRQVTVTRLPQGMPIYLASPHVAGRHRITPPRIARSKESLTRATCAGRQVGWPPFQKLPNSFAFHSLFFNSDALIPNILSDFKKSISLTLLRGSTLVCKFLRFFCHVVRRKIIWMFLLSGEVKTRFIATPWHKDKQPARLDGAQSHFFTTMV